MQGIKLVNWTDVEAVLARVEAALGTDDANLLRAALTLRGRGLTMAEYQQTLLILAGDEWPALAALVADLQTAAARVPRLVGGQQPAALAKVLGDVLWHVAMLAAACGLPLDDVARASVKRD